MRDSENFAAAAGELIDEVQSTIKDDEPAEVRERRSPLVLPGVLAIVFAGVLGWNLWLLQAASPRLSPTEARRADGVMVFVATQAVEGWAAEHGRMPENLDAVGLGFTGLQYAPASDGFSITSSQGEAPVRHDRSAPIDEFMVRMGVAPPDAESSEDIR